MNKKKAKVAKVEVIIDDKVERITMIDERIARAIKNERPKIVERLKERKANLLKKY